MHRIWGLFHRQSYADFWLGVLAEKGFFYFALMGLLAALCVLGMVVFFRHLQSNYWWRWIYLFGGGYLLFDLFAIAIDLKVWNDLLAMMFDVGSPLWNLIWGFFVLLGPLCWGWGSACSGSAGNRQRADGIRRTKSRFMPVIRFFSNIQNPP